MQGIPSKPIIPQEMIVEPPQHIKALILQILQNIRLYGFDQEERAKTQNKDDPDYSFLHLGTTYFWYFQERKRELLEELMAKLQSQQQIQQQPQMMRPMNPPPPSQPLPSSFQIAQNMGITILKPPQQMAPNPTGRVGFSAGSTINLTRTLSHEQNHINEDGSRKRKRWGDSVQILNSMTPSQLSSQHFIMPGTTLSGGNTNKKRVVLNSKNPEMLSGSLMVELVKLNKKIHLDQKGRYIKYAPINISTVPDYLYIENPENSAIKSKLLSLTEYAEEQREYELKSLAKKKGEKEREMELRKMEESGIDTYELRNPEKFAAAKRNIEKEVEDLYAYPIPKSDMHSEMGIKSDGRLASSSSGSSLGLGSGRTTNDAISAFRMARSKNYHENQEERSTNKERISENCFNCCRPGHIARDCTYGLS